MSTLIKCEILLYLSTSFVICMFRLPPSSTRTDTLFPTRRSSDLAGGVRWPQLNQKHGVKFTMRFAVRRLLLASTLLGSVSFGAVPALAQTDETADRKSTRLNSSH